MTSLTPTQCGRHICIPQPEGDYHTVVNNVAWDDNDKEDCTLCVPSELSGTQMNTNTLVANNGASKFEGGGGTVENNYESQDVKEQMVDTDNNDYRPGTQFNRRKKKLA